MGGDQDTRHKTDVADKMKKIDVGKSKHKNCIFIVGCMSDKYCICYFFHINPFKKSFDALGFICFLYPFYDFGVPQVNIGRNQS